MSEKLIGACGITCSECDAFIATQANDTAAVERVAAEWSQRYNAAIPPEVVWCDGCMTAAARKCGHCADCDVRACVQKRGLANCAECPDYGCDVIEGFLKAAEGFGIRETLESLRAN